MGWGVGVGFGLLTHLGWGLGWGCGYGVAGRGGTHPLMFWDDVSAPSLIPVIRTTGVMVAGVDVTEGGGM